MGKLFRVFLNREKFFFEVKLLLFLVRDGGIEKKYIEPTDHCSVQLALQQFTALLFSIPKILSNRCWF